MRIAGLPAAIGSKPVAPRINNTTHRSVDEFFSGSINRWHLEAALCSRAEQLQSPTVVCVCLSNPEELEV